MTRMAIFTITFLLIGFPMIVSANECHVQKKYSPKLWNGDPLKILAFTSEQESLTCMLSFQRRDNLVYDKIVLTTNGNRVVRMDQGNYENLDFHSTLNVTGWNEFTFSIDDNSTFMVTVSNTLVLIYTVEYPVKTITTYGSNISLCSANPTWAVGENEAIVIPLYTRLQGNERAKDLNPGILSIYLTQSSTTSFNPIIKVDGKKRFLTMKNGEILLSQDLFQPLHNKIYILEVQTQNQKVKINCKLGNDSKKLMEFEVETVLSDIEISSQGVSFTVILDLSSILFMTTTTTTTTSSKVAVSANNETSVGLVVGIIITLLALLALVMIIIFYMRRKRASMKTLSSGNHEEAQQDYRSYRNSKSEEEIFIDGNNLTRRDFDGSESPGKSLSERTRAPISINFWLCGSCSSSEKKRIVMDPIEGSAVSIYNENTANTDALRAVLDQPGIRDLQLVVIPVAGEFRGGKSFLLSYFIRYLTNQNFGENYEKLVGFDHKKSDEPVTQGILIWNQPLIVKVSEKKEILVLLMDSQGILGGEEDNKQASRVFALSTMLSSIMIMNLKGQINDGVLNYLQLFTSYGDVATAENGEEVNDENANEASVENALEMPFQKLLIVIRDWQNSDVYGSEGGKQYLDKDNENRKNVFDSYYRETSCYVMPHPGKDLIKPGATGCLNDLDEDFEQCMKDLIIDVCSPDHLDSHVKSGTGRPLTAGNFCDYFETCTKIIASENLDTRQINHVEINAGIECSNAKKDALSQYTSLLNKKSTDSLDGNLDIFHETAQKEATKKYEDNTRFAQRNVIQIFAECKKDLENECLRKKLMQEGIVAMKKTLRSFEKIEETLEEIKTGMEGFQTGVKVAKVGTAVTAVAGALMLFTPFAPVGLGFVIASGAAGVGTGVTDFVFTKTATNRIEECASEAKKHLEEAKLLLEKINTINFGNLSVLYGILGFADDVFGIAGKGFSAMPLLGAVFGSVGAAFSVVDAAISIVKKNSTIIAARELQEQIKGSIQDLKKQIEDLIIELYGS